MHAEKTDMRNALGYVEYEVEAYVYIDKAIATQNKIILYNHHQDLLVDMYTT